MVTMTVVLACAAIGLMLCIASGATVGVRVIAGEAVGMIGVSVGARVVGVGGSTVGEGTFVNVGGAVRTTVVMVGNGVGDEIKVGSGVGKI